MSLEILYRYIDQRAAEVLLDPNCPEIGSFKHNIFGFLQYGSFERTLDAMDPTSYVIKQPGSPTILRDGKPYNFLKPETVIKHFAPGIGGLACKLETNGLGTSIFTDPKMPEFIVPAAYADPEICDESQAAFRLSAGLYEAFTDIVINPVEEHVRGTTSIVVARTALDQPWERHGQTA